MNENTCKRCDKKFVNDDNGNFCSENCRHDHAEEYYDDKVMYEEEQHAFESDKL